MSRNIRIGGRNVRVDHDLELDEDFIDGTWTGLCSCGWESQPRNAEADAIEDFSNHCDVVFMEATGG